TPEPTTARTRPRSRWGEGAARPALRSCRPQGELQLRGRLRRLDGRPRQHQVQLALSSKSLGNFLLVFRSIRRRLPCPRSPTLLSSPKPPPEQARIPVAAGCALQVDGHSPELTLKPVFSTLKPAA